MGFMANFRHGRDEAFRLGREARAARGEPPRKEPDAGPEQDGAADQPADDAGQNSAAVAELQAALQERDGELAENKRLLAEMADYAEKMEARVVELIAGAEPMARTLRLPGVHDFLFKKFHPDKYPDADDRQRELLTEATKTISAAYALANQLQTQSSE